MAIKLLRDIADQTGNWRRAQRELTALLQLKGHANVIHVEEIIALPESPVLVMEFASGGDVLGYMKRLGAPLTVAETAFVGAEVAAALVDAHRLGIVHRDIKPQNVLIGSFGQVKVCDFGIAAITRSDGYRERTSALSMRYASPEELEGSPDVGAPTDIYSLGATLQHLVTGEAPPVRASEEEVSSALQIDAPGAPELARLIQRCMNPVMGARPTAAELVNEFEHVQRCIGGERVRMLQTFDQSTSGDEDSAREDSDGWASGPLPSTTSAPREWWT